MSVFNKLLQALKFDDDYDDYDEYDEFDDEFDEYEDEKPSKSKSRDKVSSTYEDDDDFVSTKKTTSSFREKTKSHRDNVTSFNKSEGGRSDKMSVSVIRPTTVDDGREICETLLAKRTVILNIEGLDVEVGQRIFDFTYGATFAIGGNLQKISNYIFLATPAGVDSAGDLQELFEEAVGSSSSSMRHRY